MKRKLRCTIHSPLFWLCLGCLLLAVGITFFNLYFTPTIFLPIEDQLFASFLSLLFFGYVLYQRLPHLAELDQPLSKVLVVQYDPFLTAGIEKALQANEDIVMRMINQPDEFSLLDEIYKFRPHTIVLAGWSPTIDATDLKMMLNELDQVRVISVGVQDKNVHLFEKKRFKISKSEDFAFLMRRGSRRMSIQEEGIYVKNKLFLWNDYLEDFPDDTL